jgi:dienelactone hydrolase
MRKYAFTLIALAMVYNTQAQLKAVVYTEDNQKLNGFAAIPKKANSGKPGILILPAWKGIDKHAKDSADKLSNAGYYAFIADIYGEGKYPSDAKEAGESAGYYKKNYIRYQARIKAALDELIKSGASPDKIVVMGYCFGGTGALEAARGHLPVKGVASFHGGLGKDPSRAVENIPVKILVCHGADDPYESQEEITAFQKEMRDTKADWQMIYYANAVHSFTDPDAGNDNSKGAAYNEKATKRSWEHFMIFLKEVL